MFTTVKTSRFVKKEGTKTAWKLIDTNTQELTLEQYRNCVNASPFFRRLGGSEHVVRNYTCAGYLVVRIQSTSPDKQQRTVREFSF
jgi:hypothetical protein